MRKKLVMLSLALGLLTYFPVQGQEVISFPTSIEQVKVDPLTGNVFVKTKDGFSCFNPETNQVVWTLDIKQVNTSTAIQKMATAYQAMSNNDFLSALSSKTAIDFIGNSPFAMLAFDHNSVIVNTITGNVVFNSANLGYIILTASFVPERNELLILTNRDKNIEFVTYNLIDKKINWTSTVGSVDGLGKELGNLIKGLFKNEFSDAENKVTLKNDVIYAGIKNLLFALDANNGTIMWKTDYPINNFYLNRNGDRVITILNAGGLFSTKQKLNILDAQTGNKLWKEDITTKYISYLEDRGPRILIAHQSGFNFYDYATGNKIWKKDAKGSHIKQVIPVDDDYLYVADNEMNLIDKDGKNKWKKFIEIADKPEDEVYYLGAVDNNRVFYLTDTYGNMVDYNTGKKIWKKNIEFDKKRPLVYDVSDGKYLVYNNKRIYTFNAGNTDSPKPKGKIEVNNDKTIQSLEAFDWGICIIGQNDVIGIDNEGNVLYHKTYKEPGEAARRLMKTGGVIGQTFFGTKSDLKKALANAEFVVRDENGHLVQEAYLLDEPTRQRLTDQASRYDDYSDVISKNIIDGVGKRFNGLKQSNRYAIVLAKGETGPELVKVRKADGVEVSKINLDSNKPIYEIDVVTDNIYYAADKDLKVFK